MIGIDGLRVRQVLVSHQREVTRRLRMAAGTPEAVSVVSGILSPAQFGKLRGKAQGAGFAAGKSPGETVDIKRNLIA